MTETWSKLRWAPVRNEGREVDRPSRYAHIQLDLDDNMDDGTAMESNQLQSPEVVIRA